MLSFSLLICVVRSLGEQTMAIKRFNGKNMVNNNLVIVSFFCSESFLFPMCLFLFSKNLMLYDHWSCRHFCPYEKNKRIRIRIRIREKKEALPETVDLPSAKMFAECILSGTRQTSSLLSDAKNTLSKIMALDKQTLCRVLQKHSAN